MAESKLQRPKGMHDILWEEWEYFQKVFGAVLNVAKLNNFHRIETPILEKKELFEKGVGQGTDIVEKEMYCFKTKGGDELCLRPEGTAPVVRAYFENGFSELTQPVKLWYFGPFFRHETPQAGRYRQFWQFGFEILGEKDYILDSQIILASLSVLKELKIENTTLKINSIGNSCCRGYYKKSLASYLKKRKKGLCQNCKTRLEKNPLRILDCKDEKCKQIVSQAPQILDYLCEDCKNHFFKVLDILEFLEIPFELDPFLVRGLDYYTNTVFEIESKEINLALISGGRYNNLGKIIGNKDLPGVGGAGGVERIVEVLKNKKIFTHKEKPYKFFIVQIGELGKKWALKIYEEMKEAKIEVFESLGKDSLKAQLRVAEKMKAKYIILIGQKEALEKTAILKDMETGKQQEIKFEKIIKEIKKLI